MEAAVGALGTVAVGLIGLVVFLVKKGGTTNGQGVSLARALSENTAAIRDHNKALSDMLDGLREATVVHATRSESNYTQLKEGITRVGKEMGEAEKRLNEHLADAESRVTAAIHRQPTG